LDGIWRLSAGFSRFVVPVGRTGADVWIGEEERLKKWLDESIAIRVDCKKG
jgi:hypothetical protein